MPTVQLLEQMSGGGRNLSEVGTPDGNLIIHGDNLHALKALLPTHAGRVKCIYIDPPYNTGNENWVYNDRLNSQALAHWFDVNRPVDGEDLERHDKWLCMMWPRLQLLRELLSDDGVIFVSIDDNEQHHLRVIMDEVFGEVNFVDSIFWKKKGGSGNTERHLGDIVENILMYSRDIRSLQTNRRVIENVTYNQSDANGSYRFRPLTKTDAGAYRRDTMKYGVEIPGSPGEYAVPPDGRRWTVGEKTMQEYKENDLLWFELTDNGWIIRFKDYHDENDPRTGVYLNLLTNHGSLQTAKGQLVEIGFGREEFETPKPSSLVAHLLRIVVDDGDIVLDSFAGSGTTAHAVLALNKEDGGNRKFILVECEDYADTITAERVRRVIRGVPNAKDAGLRDGLDGEFTYCTLGDPITVEGLLSGDSMPAFDQLAAYLICCATGAPVKLSDLITPDDAEFDRDTSFVYETDRQRFHLFYRPEKAWLSSNEGALNSERAEQISRDAKLVGKSAVVFGPVRYMNSADLRGLGVTFCQLPYELSAARAKLG